MRSGGQPRKVFSSVWSLMVEANYSIVSVRYMIFFMNGFIIPEVDVLSLNNGCR
jgi:hypothetical protein